MSNNLTIITFEKNLKNRINKKFNKMLKNLNKNKLHFDTMNQEIKFLNQLYFLNNCIEDLNSNLDNMNEILSNLHKKEKINLDFKDKISKDKVNKQLTGNLASFIYL
tara:strand:- start:917 stop:1237 length:321 start_codon:yes stop_codon:yes gene_type:complete